MGSVKKVSGELASRHRAEDLISLLSSPARFAPCIPGLISYEPLDDRSIRVRARLDISDAGIPEMTSITSTLTISLLSIEGGRARFRISGKAAGSSYEANLEVAVEPLEGGSRIYWSAEITLGRLLEMLDRFLGVGEVDRRIAIQALESVDRCLEKGRPPR